MCMGSTMILDQSMCGFLECDWDGYEHGNMQVEGWDKHQGTWSIGTRCIHE